MFEIRKFDLNSVTENIKIDFDKYFSNCQGNISGLGASILHGYSSRWLIGNITFVTSIKDMDGLSTGVERYIYLKDYDREIGYIGCLASPERVLCDYLMYPEELKFNEGYWDVLEGYMGEDDFTGFDKVNRMLDILNIPREVFNDTLKKLGLFTERS